MEISDQVLPPEILALFQEAEFENTGGIFIEKLEYLENSVILRLRIEGGDELPSQLWQVIVEDAVSERLSRSWISNIEIYSDHYLLWEFSDQHTELYVNGVAEKSAEYIGARFYEMHMAAFGEWLPLETYVSSAGLFTIIQVPQGLFAEGPKKILNHYEKWLKQLGKPAYTFESDGLAVHNARKDKSDLQLLILGESYFIGKQVVFQKVIG